MLKNAFHFSFKAFVLLIESVLQPIEMFFYFSNQQHMHFVGTKKGLFNPLVQLKEIPFINRNKQERAHNHCLWTALLNWRRTYCY